jgi:hypothetical protein
MATRTKETTDVAVLDATIVDAALVPAQTQALATPIRAASAGLGKEAYDDSDVYAARLSLAQDTSDQVKKRHDAYIEGLEPGMFFNSVTGQVYGPTVTFALITGTKRAGIFDGDGQMVVRDLDWNDPRCISPGEDANCKWIKPEATRIHDFLIVRLDAEDVPQVLALSCKKTAFKAAKRFISLFRATPGDTWDALYTVTAAVESNGVQDYFVPKFAYLSPNAQKRATPEGIRAFCRGIYLANTKGSVIVPEDTQSAGEADEDSVPY